MPFVARKREPTELLPQPHGFEGFLSGTEDLDHADESILDEDHGGERLVDRHAMWGSCSLSRDEREYAAAAFGGP